MNQLELLSPAGDIQIFKTAINAGADAVYFGGDLFGARAYAKNFSIDEAVEGINYAHLHGAKAYLTVNTLLKNLEIEEKLYKYLKEYVEAGIDAFIVQDFGVFNFIRNFFPDTQIHISTQTSLCTEKGAKFFENLGASRIVTAREIGINEISDIHKACPDLEIESFIHGALCVCYSGQCLMSSILGGRSGNRGRCAQPCRLPYDILDKDNKLLNNKGKYVLSPKDFYTINMLPAMIEAGVVSFKVEGRMKKEDYVAGVISVYRHYIDQYLYKGSKNYSVTEEDIKKLLDYGNRSGFTDMYLTKHNGPEMMTFEAPSHTKAENPKLQISERKIKVDCNVKANLGNELYVSYTDERGNVGECLGNIVDFAQKKAITKEDILGAVSGLGNTVFEINHIKIDYDDNIFLPISALKNARREAISDLTRKLLNDNKKIVNEYKKLDNNKNIFNKPDLFVTVMDNEQLSQVVNYSFVDSIAVPDYLFKEAKTRFNGKVYIFIPTVLRKEYIDNIALPSDADGFIASSYDELGLLFDAGIDKNKIILDHRLYTFNNRSIDGFNAIGIKYNCIPYELSMKELNHRDNSNSQMIIYSRIPMMVTANCSVKNTKGCNKANEAVILLDRKKEKFISKCNCRYCYNTIYNSKKYMAFELKDQLYNLGLKDFRIDFTIESSDEVNQIMSLYNDVFNNDNPVRYLEDITKGHLKRGVE